MEPKFVPVMVTDVPLGPVNGDRLEIVGVGNTLKTAPLLGLPETVITTFTFPVLVPAGTGTTICESLQLAGVPTVPLKVTVLDPFVAPKYVPLIVTSVPTGPIEGDNAEMFGGNTVKL